MTAQLSSADVAARLGISTSQVNRHAAAHGIGQRVGQRTRTFSQRDVARLRVLVGTVGTYKRKGKEAR